MFEYSPFTASTSGSSQAANGNRMLGQALVSLLASMNSGSASAGTAPAGTTSDAMSSYAPGTNPWASPGGGFNIQQPKSGLSY